MHPSLVKISLHALKMVSTLLKILAFNRYQRLHAGVIHFWKDTTGNFGFQHFHSLHIRDVESENKHENGSDDDDVNEKREEAVFAWTMNSGQPMMASGYMGLLRVWSPNRNQEGTTPELFNRATTVRHYILDSSFVL